MDYGKGALVFTTWAIHIHSVTIAFSGGGISNYYAGYDDDDDKDNNGRHKGRSGDASDRDDAIKAFLILAYLLYQHRPCRPRALVLVLQNTVMLHHCSFITPSFNDSRSFSSPKV